MMMLPSTPVVDEAVVRVRSKRVLWPISKLWWQGETHAHPAKSTRPGWGYPEGVYSINEIVRYYESLGLEFVCFTEHASRPGSPSVLQAEDPILLSLESEAKQIQRLNQKNHLRVCALSGVETSMVLDVAGTPQLDVPDPTLQKLDFVIASRHALPKEFEKGPDSIFKTLSFAARHSLVHAIGHPDRYTRHDHETEKSYSEQYWQMWDTALPILEATNTAFEINLNSPPSRKLLSKVAASKIPLCIGFDAHDFHQFRAKDDPLVISGIEPKKLWAKEHLDSLSEMELCMYKTACLSLGPGYRPLMRLRRVIKQLEKLGVAPARVINSSAKALVGFLYHTHNRRTHNLYELARRLLVL